MNACFMTLLNMRPSTYAMWCSTASTCRIAQVKVTMRVVCAHACLRGKAQPPAHAGARPAGLTVLPGVCINLARLCTGPRPAPSLKDLGG